LFRQLSFPEWFYVLLESAEHSVFIIIAIQTVQVRENGYLLFFA
jgi:hypothetical protein